eukprot:TRINITY_DN2974_c0_g1_i1.p1 TRINITY_DN2974_c0_g1~~TRINITY_DN2974_c0_g1_i1.p1  ORF type:complete len:234 (-),score=20.12 TRINITY_DN2974_c0_g1_i1:248-907(-)
MVRQADIDSLFAKPSDTGTHCFICGACAIFDFTLYPVIVYLLFINVPDFLKGPDDEEGARMFIVLKIGLLSAFTMVMCIYQIMFFDLVGQHAGRICRYLFYGSPKKPGAGTSKDLGVHRLQAPEYHNGITVAPASGKLDRAALLPGMVSNGNVEVHHGGMPVDVQATTADSRRYGVPIGKKTNLPSEEADSVALEEGVGLPNSSGDGKKKEGKRVKFLL